MKTTSMLLRFVSSSLIAGAALSATLTHAETPPVPPGPYPVADFDAADRDQNGSLSLQEFTRYREAELLVSLESLFKIMDSNGNGLLTLDEYNAFFPSGSNNAEMMAAMAGADGVATQEEFVAWRLANTSSGLESNWEFAALDINHDGILTRDEVSAPLAPTLVVEPTEYSLPGVVLKSIDPDSAQARNLIKVNARIAATEQKITGIETRLETETNPAEVSKLNRRLKTLNKVLTRLQTRAKKLSNAGA